MQYGEVRERKKNYFYAKNARKVILSVWNLIAINVAADSKTRPRKPLESRLLIRMSQTFHNLSSETMKTSFDCIRVPDRSLTRSIL